MAINRYMSTDTGAPAAITNVAGTLVTVMDACLVNGYSPGTVSSITRSGSTATLTFSSAHGLTSKGHRLTIAGADQAEYNGTYNITVVNTTQISYTVSGTPVTPATGTITATKPGAGWTIAYTGTNLRAYRMGAGNQRYLRIDDTGTITARTRGYGAMTDVNTGTDPFPTDAQISGGGYIAKSNGAPARAWMIIASDKWFFYRCFYDGTNYGVTFFGDYTSYLSGVDNYNTILITENTSGITNAFAQAGSSPTNVIGHYKIRSYTQTGSSTQCSKTGGYQFTGGTTIGSTGPTYPDPVTGNLLVGKMHIQEPTGLVTVGWLDMFLLFYHNRPLADLDTFPGDGNFAGNTYIVHRGAASAWAIRII